MQAVVVLLATLLKATEQVATAVVALEFHHLVEHLLLELLTQVAVVVVVQGLQQ
jgi:hypothetical protein